MGTTWYNLDTVLHHLKTVHLGNNWFNGQHFRALGCLSGVIWVSIGHHLGITWMSFGWFLGVPLVTLGCQLDVTWVSRTPQVLSEIIYLNQTMPTCILDLQSSTTCCYHAFDERLLDHWGILKLFLQEDIFLSLIGREEKSLILS